MQAQSKKQNNPRNNNQGIRGNKKRRRGNRRNNGWRGLEETAQYAATRVLRMLGNTEDKFIDTTATNGFNNTATLILLNGCVVGSTQSTRVGMSTKSTGLDFNATITLGTSATVNAQYVRLMLVRDEQSQLATFNYNTLMSSVNNICSLRLVDYLERFHMFMDEIVALSLEGPQGFILRKHIPMAFHTRYCNSSTSNTGTVADIDSNALFLVILSTESANIPVVDYYVRFWFVDN